MIIINLKLNSLNSKKFNEFFLLPRKVVSRRKNFIVFLVGLLFLLSSCEPIYVQNLTASYYTVKSCYKEGTSGTMANGRRLDDEKLTTASWDYKFGTKVKVTNTRNGRSVVCEVTDRGPNRKLYKQGRVIDLSYKAMYLLDGIKSGVIPILIEVVNE